MVLCRKHLLKITLLLLLILITVTSCSSGKKPDAPRNSQANAAPGPGGPPQGFFQKTVTIAATTIKPRKIYEKITVGARAKSSSVIRIVPDNNGTITQILVKEGDRVRKGSILLYVDASKAGEKYLPNPVTSTINGIVSFLPVSVGNTVGRTTTVAIITDPSKNKVYASIPEKYVLKIKKGLGASLQLSSLPTKVFQLTISEIPPQVSKTTGTLDIILTFNKDQDISNVISGMYGSLSLTLAEYENQIVIQRDTIVLENNQEGKSVSGVFVLDNPAEMETTVSFVPIVSGIEDNNDIQVLDGLKENDVIVTLGQSHLNFGSPVLVLELDGEKRVLSETSKKSNKG